MADQKISQLTSLTGANTASGDLVTVVDISDTTMGASGTNKKMTLAEFQASPVSAGTANGVVYLNGTKVPSSGSVLTFDGTYFNANGLRLAGADVTNTIYQATGALGISTGSASGIIFSPNATARMALDASGNLGIGTVSPTRRLEVVGSAAALAMSVQTTGAGEVARFSDGTAQTLILGTTASGVYYNNANSGLHAWLVGGTERMRLDASGNLGLGVTPSAWGSNFKAMDIGGNAAIAGYSNSMYQLANAYAENAAYRYKASTFSSAYLQTAGQHQWFTAPSGTAGNVISFTQAMTLDANSTLSLPGKNGYAPLSIGAPPTFTNVSSAFPGLIVSNNSSGFGYLGASGNSDVRLYSNGYYNTSGNEVYGVTGQAAGKYSLIQNSHVWSIAPSGTAGNTVAFTQAMTLDASGNLGVGTASPGVKLDVNGAARILAGSALYFQNAAADTNATISCTGGSGNNAMSFNSGAMLLDASGNLGIGTASPTSKLDVAGANNDYIQYRSGTRTTGIGTLNGLSTLLSGAGTELSFNIGGEKMRLDASGNLGLNTSTFGTSAAGVLSLGTGTAPTTGPADTVQLFSVDRSAGNTIPGIRCEGSGVTNAGITSTAVTNKIAVQVNGTIYYLLATTNAT